MQSTLVALIDPNKLFREGLKALIEDQNFRISLEASSAQAALETLSVGEQPDLILIDPTIGSGKTADTIGALKAAAPNARLVLLVTQFDAPLLSQGIQGGADGILMKDISLDALAQSLRLVMMGEKVFPTQLASLLISGRLNGSELADGLPSRKGLSQRETQILHCLLNGDSNKMIANHLHITEATVKVHLKSLLRKINASNRTQAAIWAMNNGFAEDAAPQQMAG